MTIAASGDTVLYDLGNGRYRSADVVVSVDRSGNSTGASALGAGTDRSGTITLGGTAQTLAAANTARIGLEIQNIDPSEEMWVNENGGTAAANTAGSNFIAARGSVTVSTNRAISVVAATTGHKWTAIEL